MNDREWLRQQGFTVGDRGRLSADMKAALAKRSESHSNKINESAKAVTLPSYGEPVREALSGFIIDRGSKPGQADIKIAFSSCGVCTRPIQFCKCSHGPYGPKWLNYERLSV